MGAYSDKMISKHIVGGL